MIGSTFTQKYYKYNKTYKEKQPSRLEQLKKDNKLFFQSLATSQDIEKVL